MTVRLAVCLAVCLPGLQVKAVLQLFLISFGPGHLDVRLEVELFPSTEQRR